MARSRRKTPIYGNVVCRSEKTWKQIWHRRHRKAVKQALRTGQPVPHYREHSDPWWMGKDGKRYFGDMLSDDREIDSYRRTWHLDCETWSDVARKAMRK